MKVRSKLLPWLSLGAGAVGSIACSLLCTADADDRGLLLTSPTTLIGLYGMVAVFLLLLFLNLRKVNYTPAYETIFPRSWHSLAGCIAGSAGIVCNLILTAGQRNTPLTVIAAVFGGLSAISLLVVGYLQQKQLRPHYCFHSILTIYLILDLVVFYQTWNTQPQLESYLRQLLALVFLMMCSYQRAALDGDMGNCRDFAFWNLGAVFLCCLAAVSPAWPFFLGTGIWCFTSQCPLIEKPEVSPMELPDAVLYCMDILNNAGHSVYVVGGCVRDHILELSPADYDLCTDATPDQICDLFSRHTLIRNGEKHGTIGVVVAGQPYEITTFRTEGDYSDARHPDSVTFVADVQEDLARRDFTVNAMAYTPAEGLVDPFGGHQDLKERILRTVGDPETRFKEDALRILRGVRFAVRFDLTPEEKTLEAMGNCASLMDQLARERVSSELCKLLPLISGEQMLCYRDVFIQVIPELAPQNDTDLYSQVAQVVEKTSTDLPIRMAALLFPLGVETAEAVLVRLKTSNALRNHTLQLIRLQATDLPLEKKQLLPIVGAEGEDAVKQAIHLQKAIAAAAGQDVEHFEMAELLVDTIGQDGSCLSVKDLAITGSDLLALGAKAGPSIGKCMQSLLSLVQENLLSNTREELLDAAKSFLEL